MAHILRSFHRRMPWLGAAVLWGIGLVLFIRYPLNVALFSPHPYLMDFNVYRTVAQRVLAGQAELLYAPTTPTTDMMVFKYAPIWAAAWAPLGWWPVYQGAIVWTALSAAALTAALAGCRALCRWDGLQAHPLAAAAAVALLTRPLAEEMGNGQVNALWTALTVGGIAAAARRRPWTAAACFAASMLLKLPALLFLAYFFLRRHWGLLGRTLACFAAGLWFGSWLLLPAHPWRLVADWAGALARNGAAYAFEIGNQSALVWLARFLTPDPYGLNLLSLPRAAVPWIALSLLAGLLWIVSRPGGTPASASRRWLYDSAMLMTMMVLFSPTAWVASYLALAWPIYLSLTLLTPPPGGRRPDRWAQTLTIAMLAVSLFQRRDAWRALGLTSWRGESYLFLVFMVLPWMGLLAWASLARQRRVSAA